mgnify:CR=1 FL=1
MKKILITRKLIKDSEDKAKKIFDDLKKAGILVAGQQAANYFPRRFQHSKIKARSLDQ